MSAVGARIRCRREELGLSLTTAAQMAGVAKGYLWKIEDDDTSRPSAETLYRLAKTLETTMERLLGYEPLDHYKIDRNP